MGVDLWMSGGIRSIEYASTLLEGEDLLILEIVGKLEQWFGSSFSEEAVDLLG